MRQQILFLFSFMIFVLAMRSANAQPDNMEQKGYIAAARSVSFDSIAVLINGERSLLISGEMHYARSPRELWPQLLDRSREMGLNSIASYVFWDFHEPEKDVYDFSGQRDIGYFLSLCKERNLDVILRIGPYCCAEWNFGGYPPYLRDEPGITLRTYNKPYMDRVEKYFKHLAAEVRPFLAANGGPVILVQVENEYANVAKRYGEDGQKYLEWVVELAGRVGFDVQKITCEGGAEGAIECVNGHSIPSDRSERHKTNKPEQPLLWTELWPAWYNTWGYQQHFRDARNIAFHILNFLGSGGTGWNYYMWHGGTNFGRTSMYLQTTSYDFDAPLDEYGRPTLKGKYLSKLHHVVTANSKLFLDAQRSQVNSPSGIMITTWRKGNESIILYLNENNKEVSEGNLTLPARSARLSDENGNILFDTWSDYQKVEETTHLPEWKNLITPEKWRVWNEPMPVERDDNVFRSFQPAEQLGLTKDQSDYCWYSNSFDTQTKENCKIDISYGGDFFYIYLDGKLVTQSQPPFMENRGATMPESPANPYIFANALEEMKLQGFKHTFLLKDVSAGPHRIDILASALGLVKGDWSISGSMNTERKGIWQEVYVNQNLLSNWEMRPFLIGEQFNIPNFPNSVKWNEPVTPKPCSWYIAELSLSKDVLLSDADFRIDAHGLGKGMMFINGHMLGRYWLIEGQGYGPDEGWQKLIADGLILGPEGKPTQRYYHVPKAWLKENNQLILFEEQSVSINGLRLQTRVYD